MSLRPNTIKSSFGAKKVSKRRGRGNASGKGNYSGRGGKGQKARSGGKSGLKLKGFKTLLQSTPKLRGFKSASVRPAEVFLSDLEKRFAEGEVVSLASLIEKKIVDKNTKTAKILATGELKKKLTVENVFCTTKAAELVKKVGGTV